MPISLQDVQKIIPLLTSKDPSIVESGLLLLESLEQGGDARLGNGVHVAAVLERERGSRGVGGRGHDILRDEEAGALPRGA